MSETEKPKSTIDTEDYIKRWKRFNEAAAAEKSWMHRRLRWMFIPQAILITAYGYLILNNGRACAPDNQYELLLALILWIGFFLAVLALAGVIAAGVMHWQWTTQLNYLAKVLNDHECHKCRKRRKRHKCRKCRKLDKQLVPFGSPPHWPARTSSVIPSLLAILFVLSWSALLMTNIFDLDGKTVLFLSFLAYFILVLVVLMFAIFRSHDTCN